MSLASAPDDRAPDSAAQRAILLFAIFSGILLLVAHEALDANAAWFNDRSLRTLWFTLATAPPLFAALCIQRLGDRRFWLGLAAYTLLLSYLAYYSGRAMEPNGIEVGAVALPYVWTLIASGHVLSAWFAVSLRREGYGYPLLFEAAWRMVSTLAQVFAYTGAFWLLLLLWAALFKALGIEFFRELFELPRFIYPVTSLVAGYGLVIARTRSSLGDAVHLRVLALWRGLLPLAALLALAFAGALLLRGVEPLWATRHATQLLLALVFALVALANAAYGKGGEAQPRHAIRWLVTAALTLLPLFVALAAWALSLRWRQYGLSLDRLWAALLVFVAGVYALGYAVAALRRDSPVWLAGIAPVNRAASLIAVVLLLLTQTGALDFRAITAHSLLARGAELKDEDLGYLRWELGHPGLYALQRLQTESEPERARQIAALIARKRRWEFGPVIGDGPPRLRLAADLGPLPQGLQHFAETHVNGPGSSNDCGEPAECWLLRADLIPGGDPEWLRLRMPAPGLANESQVVQLEVLKPCAQAWCVAEVGVIWRDAEAIRTLRRELEANHYRPAPQQKLDLEVGGERLEFWR
ncbi:MAG: DUF4153 domain-containing protein [Stagnimonas sp.]|nr:DUF4153 domain-containing protein [Stagnimonas sp.]